MQLTKDPLKLLRKASRRLICIEVEETGDRLIVCCKRATSRELSKLGVLALVGADVVAEIKQSVIDEAQHEMWKLGARTAEEMEAAEEKIRASKARAAASALDSLANNPKTVEALIERSDAWVCASVEGIGIAKEGVDLGVLPLDSLPPVVCEVLGTRAVAPGSDQEEPVYLVPIRLVLKDPGPGDTLLYEYLSEETRASLGALIQKAFDVTKEVRPL